MNIYTEFEKELLERIGNIESRLESIERMLGDTISEPLWTTGTNPQTDKMVRVHINFGPVRHVGHISNDGIWTVYDLDGDKDQLETIKNYFGIVLSWRELTEEENTICWERGILGSSEEHAELSTLELPIAKQEPEWRPMSAAPLDREIIVNHQSVAYFASYHFGFDAWECTPDDRNSMYFYFKYEDLLGWRPL